MPREQSNGAKHSVETSKSLSSITQRPQIFSRGYSHRTHSHCMRCKTISSQKMVNSLYHFQLQWKYLLYLLSKLIVCLRRQKKGFTVPLMRKELMLSVRIPKRRQVTMKLTVRMSDTLLLATVIIF